MALERQKTRYLVYGDHLFINRFMVPNGLSSTYTVVSLIDMASDNLFIYTHTSPPKIPESRSSQRHCMDRGIGEFTLK